MLKTSTTPIVGIFKQICCFDEVFLMVYLYRKTFIRASRVRHFSCAPNNMFTYRIVHLKFRSIQIVVCARVYTNIPHHAPTTKKKYFRIEGKLSSHFIHLFLARDRRSWLVLFITNTVATNFFFTPVVKGSWTS